MEESSPNNQENTGENEKKDQTPSTDAEKKQTRVQLHPVVQTVYSSSSTDDGVVRLPGSKLLAVILRLRVTQIVAGIIIILLGAVACLEPTTRFTLVLAMPTGAIIVIVSIVHIQTHRRQFFIYLLNQAGPGSAGLMLDTPIPGGRIGSFVSFLPTLTCILASMPLLGLSILSMFGHERNAIILGCLIATCSLIVMVTDASVWLIRWQWANKPPEE